MSPPPPHRPSVVLLASGVRESVAVNAVRVSVGRDTTREDIDTFLADLQRTLDTLTCDQS